MKSKIAYFRFYEELNDFLPKEKQKIEFDYLFSGNPSIKDAIEAIGIPHTEVDLILVNSQSVNFSYQLQQNDHVSVYPTFETFDISKINRLRPEPLRNIKFVLDVHLGKLAKYLRLFGFDTLYERNYQDDEIIEIATQARIVLTRDKGILKNNAVTHGYFVRNTNPLKQIKEIMIKFDLFTKVAPFTRCLECNHLLASINKEAVADSLPEKTFRFYQEFSQCDECKRIYWKGTHYKKLKVFVDEFLSKEFNRSPD